MVTKTGKNDPRIDPMVDRAYTRPATEPASEVCVVSSLIANGDVHPKSVIGIAKISIVPANAPATIGASKAANAVAAYNNIGLDISGISDVVKAAQQIRLKYFIVLGVLSANVPPM